MPMNNLLLFAAPWFVFAVLAEYFWTKKRNKNWFVNKDTATSMLMGTDSLFTNAGIKLVTIGIYFWVADHRIFSISLQPEWLLWLVTLFFQDFFYYWFHRGSHKVRVLWAAHVNHHSSEEYNLSTALRQSWSTFFGFVFYLPMAFVGFPLEAIFTAAALNLIYQFWIHTQAINKMPAWFEAVFNTPSHHRVHHGTNPQYIDKNYAGVLIIWDRLFSSFEPEQEKVNYGLTKNIKTHNLSKVAFQEWLVLFRDIKNERRGG